MANLLQIDWPPLWGPPRRRRPIVKDQSRRCTGYRGNGTNPPLMPIDALPYALVNTFVEDTRCRASRLQSRVP